MNGDKLGNHDEWEQRGADVCTAIRLAFPISFLDRDCLQSLVENAARPLTPKGGFLTRIYSRIYPSAWIDDELLDFMKLLRNHDWAQIDWNHNWMVIPILPESAFTYCLPGIMIWVTTDPKAAYEAIEGLINYSLARIFLQQRNPGCKASSFTFEQKKAIASFLHLLRDLSINNDPHLQGIATDIIQVCAQSERFGSHA